MKFFTPTWWFAPDTPDKAKAFGDYDRHWRTVRHFLPDEVSAFEAAHTLHDARVRRLRHEETDGTLVLDLDGWDAAFSTPLRIALRFGGVRVFSQRLPVGAAAIAAEDDLGYWEWDWTGDAIELRLLFASSAEVRVVATRFAFAVSPSSRPSAIG